MPKINSVYIIEVILRNQRELIEVYLDKDRKKVKDKLDLLNVRIDDGYFCIFDGILINTNNILSIDVIKKDIVCPR